MWGDRKASEIASCSIFWWRVSGGSWAKCGKSRVRVEGKKASLGAQPEGRVAPPRKLSGGIAVGFGDASVALGGCVRYSETAPMAIGHRVECIFIKLTRPLRQVLHRWKHLYPVPFIAKPICGFANSQRVLEGCTLRGRRFDNTLNECVCSILKLRRDNMR